MADKVYSAPATDLVISEVQIGQSGTGNAGNDFIELYNPKDTSVDLNGYRLVKRTAGDITDDSIKAWDSEAMIPAHGYYLWANSGWTPPVTPDATTAATIAADNGVALRQGPADIGTIVDSVGWDQAANVFVEGTAFPQDPPNDNSIERKACVGSTTGNSEDTNNNADDFVLKTTPEPQNASSGAEVPTCTSATPSPTPTVTPTEEPTDTPSPTPTATPTDEPTDTPTPTATPTDEPTETASPTPEPTESPTPEPTETPEPTVEPTDTPVPTGTPSSVLGFRLDCRIEFREFRGRFFRLSFPHLVCSIVR
ncbi:hypothetical protein A2803_01890 [Candidatus Woesebacteria bacterium RIFCSPHIGHO2_01_FULL_44_21]|uniref:LTD domain-containing protein n=1 Tax=Candidatus Woesebacteria bacterium RIFCSPHIGHO2_01_FULL_44_21 TaxID=1802503 RepID=A0A1F7YV40_9BACT|nr:MAG: hypothetical protein A2803_01890 [Candidatus Woesebacteria bacterium RIFCSPHIGHO2_01_FULL_44_21]OGM69623.1 MAG: hypothetical protein A2897_03405 [Candidatus Woesebacteria bacterium RIFCSPLOWO2_01_FULL_44_24b]